MSADVRHQKGNEVKHRQGFTGCIVKYKATQQPEG